MDMFTSTSSSTKNISQSLVNKNHLRNVNYSEGIYVRKITESDISPNPIIITPHENLYLGRKKAEEEGEIDVFGAEKYFNHVDDENLKVQYKYVKDEQSVEIGLAKPKIQPGTASIYSESSWNSQNVLLQNVVRNSPRRKPKKRHGKKGLLASLGCNCSCKDRDSVEIDEQFSESKSKTRDGTVSKEHIEKNGHDTVDLAQINASRLHCIKIDEVGNGFTFPILNSKAENLAIKARLQEHDDDGDDNKQREFFEVFGSPVLEKKIQAGSDAIIIHTDAESDASSDLFEIESLKNNPNYPYLLRQASDGMSSCVTPTIRYAPSEASIEWSVVTASAADFSAMSDTEDLITSSEAVTKAQKMGLNEKTAARKEADRRHSGILLSCKSDKAVRVAGDAYRTNGKASPDPRRHVRGLDSFGPVTQLQPENKLTSIDFDAHSLSRSHSARDFTPFVHSVI